MGDNYLNSNSISSNSFSDVLNTKCFGELSEENQKHLLDKVADNVEKDGGFMGKLFGNKKENAAMNIAVTICLLLAVIGLCCMCFGKEYWNVILPAITTGMGYIFGRGDK